VPKSHCPDRFGAVHVIMVRSVPGFDPRLTKESHSLASRGYKVTVLGWDRQHETGSKRLKDGDISIELLRLKASYGNWSLVIYMWVWWAWVLTKVLFSKANFVHASDLDSLIPCLLAAKIKGIPIFHDVYDNYADKSVWVPNFVRPVIRMVERFLSRFVDCVIIPDGNRIDLFEGAARDIKVILNTPPDIPGIQGSPQSENGAGLCLLVSGQLHRNRGLQLVAEAANELQRINVLTIGLFYDKNDELTVAKSSKFRHLGRVAYEDALLAMGKADVIVALYDPVIPINVKASSNKVFEAMMAAKPVIINRETAIAKVVQAFDCGLTPEYSRGGFIEACRQLLDDPELRDRLGTNGRRAYVEHFSWSRMEPILFGIYDHCVTKKARKRHQTDKGT